MPLISVIVPVYNVEEFLPCCVDSVLSQSFRDFELILVDDGSPDSCPVICDRYHQTDDRVTVIHQSNRGVSAARNAGIERAAGDYIWFLDSDDYLSEDALKIAYQFARRKKADIVAFGCKTFPERTWAEELNPQRNVVYYRDPVYALFKETGSLPYACSKLIRKDLIIEHSTRFDTSLTYGEDQSFLIDLFPFARRIVYRTELLYYYRQRPGSAMNRADNTNDRMADFYLRIIRHVFDSWKQKQLFPLYGDLLADWIRSRSQIYYDSCSDSMRQKTDAVLRPMLAELSGSAPERTTAPGSKRTDRINRIRRNGIFAFLAGVFHKIRKQSAPKPGGVT